jgi:hypothetical protein
MPPAVAKQPKKTGGGDGPKRGPGRPPTEIETAGFSCRAALTLIEAYKQLAKVTRHKKAGTELLAAAEDHLVRMYHRVVADPESEFISADHVPGFLEAAEAFLKEAGRWPLPKSS